MNSTYTCDCRQLLPVSGCKLFDIQCAAFAAVALSQCVYSSVWFSRDDVGVNVILCSNDWLVSQVFSRRDRSSLKIIGKEFQKNVIRRYLERSIQKKFFSNLHSLQIKTIFQEKKLFTVAVYVIYIYGRDVIGANCECL